MTIQQKLLSWFEQQSGQTDIDQEANYFETGLIDSFDVIMLMDYCESEFGVVFSESQFEDRRFSTILGLVEIINELKG
jgi:D-alanine--poly(phosphoribitol) ligase subunit 2